MRKIKTCFEFFYTLLKNIGVTILSNIWKLISFIVYFEDDQIQFGNT